MTNLFFFNKQKAGGGHEWGSTVGRRHRVLLCYSSIPRRGFPRAERSQISPTITSAAQLVHSTIQGQEGESGSLKCLSLAQCTLSVVRGDSLCSAFAFVKPNEGVNDTFAQIDMPERWETGSLFPVT